MKLKFILFILLLVFPILHLVAPGLPVTHDGQDHVARIANFYQSLTEGNIIPRWGSNLNWGFGHPILMFLYPLPSYAGSLFHFLGFSLVDSTKLVFAVSFILSGLCMWLWARDHWGDEAGFIAGLLYSFAPYRFVDLTVRGAIGEHVAFIFLPLTFYGLYGIAKKTNTAFWIFILSISLAGLLLSHNAVSLMMIPLFLLYSVYIWLFEVNKSILFIVSVVVGVITGCLSSAFFWFPAFFEGKYTLRDIVTSTEVLTRMVSPISFFYSPWNYGGGAQFTKEVGILQWIFTGALLFLLRKKITLKKNIVFAAGLIVLFIISLFIMTSSSVFIWKNITILQKFQFPWRFLTITVFITATIGGMVTSFLSKNKQSKLLFFIALVLVVTTFHMWQPKAYKTYDESFFTGIYPGTTDTGESSPIWSVRFMESKPTSPIEVIEGNASIEPLFRNTTSRMYKITASKRTRLVENTLYFPGWNIIDNGTLQPIEFQDQQWRGRMTFWVEPGDHVIEILFTNTKLRKFANVISIIGGVVTVSLLILALFNQNLKKV